MAVTVKHQETSQKDQSKIKKTDAGKRETNPTEVATLPAHGVVYSKRLNLCPFVTPPLQAYTPILGDERTERLQRAAARLQGLKLLELNATAQGGGVAEMLYSSVPFLNELGIEERMQMMKAFGAELVLTSKSGSLKEAHYFTIARDIRRETRLRLGSWTAEEITPLEALKKWLESKKVSPERTKVLLEYGEKLIQGRGPGK